MDAIIAYASRAIARPRYHANDHSRDVLEIEKHLMPLVDARITPASLAHEGFALQRHISAIEDFSKLACQQAQHAREIERLVAEATGADMAVVNSPGVVRFSERSGRAGSLNNSMPARFAHVDVSDSTAEGFASRSAPAGRAIARFAHYNVWRVLSPPPQDVPLTLCDARSVSAADLIKADAVFDETGKDDWSFEGLVVAHNPAHRWCWFPNMTRDEVIIFTTQSGAEGAPHCVPHVAFDLPDCPPDAPARISVEMRAVAYWFA